MQVIERILHMLRVKDCRHQLCCQDIWIKPDRSCKENNTGFSFAY